MVRILHFADAHIDIANHGRHDPQTGLPLRVIDFLKSLDTIVDTAISEKVDLVLFAGDAYKDRSPAPTFQREWGRRMIRLSRAGIPTLLLVGNHDLSPALGRAHALEEFATLEVPHIHVVSRPAFLSPAQLEGLPLQVLALPWISRSGMLAHLGLQATDPAQVYEELEARLSELVQTWLGAIDPALPTVLAAHVSVQGAVYGGERAIMLGNDLVLSGGLVRDPRLDYVALGHIHKPQNLTSDTKQTSTDPPPVIYPGSIEKVDFGEANDEKCFVLAQVERGHASVEWRKIPGLRRFFDRHIQLTETHRSDINGCLRAALPGAHELEGAIVRLVVEYPRDWEAQIDDAALRDYCVAAFEFHLVKRPQVQARIRLPDGQPIGSLTPLDLLDLYWRASHVDTAESQVLKQLARDLIAEVHRDLQS